MKQQLLKKTIFTLGLSFIATSIFAQKAGDTILGVGGAFISPNTGINQPVTTGNAVGLPLLGGATAAQYFNSKLTGTTADIANTSTLTLSVLHMFTDNIAAELSGGIPPKFKVSLYLPNGSAPKQHDDAATAKVHTPALVAKYLFMSPTSEYRPYLGLGVTHASFKSVTPNTSDSTVMALAGTSSSMSSSWAPIYNAGVIYNINDKWSINASVSYIPLKSDVVLVGPGVGAGSVTTTAKLTMNPTDYIVRLGYKF